ncbi:ABC transporter substrate-binding protein [Paraflavitalea pollutisoli]|uniref:ABC transporter substrate-binding protein n=1 Tax=Paraflavitalea pollutisoli TaxID=3034143 RepID=UPI0023EAE045|nr:extracellular solute-binding protein [Paraflavitalea sp. H1-2-19X]
MATITLKGITWAHSRGITPLLAAAQRFNELYPHTEIVWEKRSLQHFADYPLEKLTDHYDLLIIDHPWVGCAAATGCVLPLDQYLPAAYLDEQATSSVGQSHRSYQYKGHQWALAIDAATPVASYRPDLLAANNTAVPQSWQEVIALAAKGKVAVPAIPIDLLMNFYTFCIACGQEPFQSTEVVIDTATGLQALAVMRQLYANIDPIFFTYNPIAVAERMSRTNDYWYCPFAYGYSNYSRLGYGQHLLQYEDVVNFGLGQKLLTTIGGTGLAVSAASAHKEVAIRFAELVVSPAWQAGIYVQNGGQPGHLSAWTNEEANRITHRYFHHVLPAMERGYMRPRYNGYLYFQDHAGDPLHQYLREGGSPGAVLEAMNKLYRQSLVKKETVAI